MRRGLRIAALACALWALRGPGAAHAHAPLPRGLAVAPDASGRLALRMPGFGWLVRSASSLEGAPRLEYVCDALLGVSPLEERAPMAYGADGVLYVGTAAGVRRLGLDNCPLGDATLAGTPVVALATIPSAPGAPERVVAITQAADGGPAIVQRSDDGGATWTSSATLPALPVTALVASSDGRQLYVGQAVDAASASISISLDGGASFERIELPRALTLLAVQAEPARAWAMARLPGQAVGVGILRADGVRGPWQEVLTVNFFGGFAIDPSDADVIWVGDEARGVFRSSDGGERFEETQPEIASACLGYGAGALWACTPGLPEQPALVRSPDAVVPFEPVSAFRDVERLVACPGLDVPATCAAAWVEWQRDVLMDTPMAGADAGALGPSVGDAAYDEPDAAAEPGAVPAGCSVRAARSASQAAWALLPLLAPWLTRLRAALRAR